MLSLALSSIAPRVWTAGRRGTIAAMLTHPRIDPVALQIGPLAIHWYGLTYLLAFGLFVLLARRRLRHEPYASLSSRGGGAPGSRPTSRTCCSSACWG